MQLGIITFRNAASFRNQADLLSKCARTKGYEVLDTTLAEMCVGPPKYRFDKFIAVMPLWPRYLFDIVRVVAWSTRKSERSHIIYGPVDGPYQMNVGLFKLMRNMRLCAPSQWCADMIRKSAEVSCMVCHHGINHKDFVFSEDRIQSQRKTWLGDKKERPILFANLNPIHRKGFPQLCKAIGILYEKLGDTFLFVLHTRRKQAIDLYPRIEKVPCLLLEDTYNTLPFRAIALKTAAADVYVNPSLQEGFGLPILEAMASHTVIVTSTAPAVSELVTDKEAWVFPITRIQEEKWNNGFMAQLHMYAPSSLARAMEHAITKKASSKNKAQAAYEKSLNYDYMKVYTKLLNL